MYKLTNSNSIHRISDGAGIPMAEGNSDYVRYLEWVAEGNTPLPVDPPPQSQLLTEINTTAQNIIYAKWPIWAQQNCNDGTYPPADKETMLADKAAVLTEAKRLTDAIIAGTPAIPTWPAI
jgi:hypothetical protein